MYGVRYMFRLLVTPKKRRTILFTREFRSSWSLSRYNIMLSYGILVQRSFTSRDHDGALKYISNGNTIKGRKHNLVRHRKQWPSPKESDKQRKKKILEKSNWIELWATREQYWIVRELNCLTLWKFISIFLLKLWYHHAFWILDLTSSFTFSIYPSHSPNLNCIRTDRLVYTGENEGIMVIIMMMMRLWMIYCAEAKCLNFRDTLQTDQSAFSGN